MLNTEYYYFFKLFLVIELKYCQNYEKLSNKENSKKFS